VTKPPLDIALRSGLPQSIQRWGLLRIFTLTSFISIAIISAISGYYFSVIRKNMLDHELNISFEFIQSITLINDQEAFFLGREKFADRFEVEEFLSHIINLPDVFRVVAYSLDKKVLWANIPDLIGKTVPDNDQLERALAGESLYLERGIENLQKSENETIPDNADQFIETYIPVWDRKHTKIIGALNIFKSPSTLYHDIDEAKILLIMTTLIIAIIPHWILYWIVHSAHKVIETQRLRIRQATNRTVELNEQSMRRIGSELHDGPAQSIGYALLVLDALNLESGINKEIHHKIKNALGDALQEIRNLSSGLVIPELEDLTMSDAISQVIKQHEKRTGTQVDFRISPIPEQMRTSIKICVYRFVQESLNNAFRHAKGQEQVVEISYLNHSLSVTVSDGGPGISDEDLLKINSTSHLGLRGLRERVESLGGIFRLENKPGSQGLCICAELPIQDGGAKPSKRRAAS
jgi:signal transduction histidine kinase